MPLIIPANSASASGYTIDNSCRFNVASSDSLTKSFGSAGNRAVWTWSAWIKVGGDAGFNGIFTAGDWTGGSTATGIILYNNQFYIYWNNPAGGTSPSAKFRDSSAWYHVVLTANTSTLKLYVNSVEYASKSISGSGEINNASSEQAIGKYSNGSSTFNGYMSEVCFIDGTAYAPTDFGEFDSGSGIWKPIDVSGLTFGTNGFYLDFEDSAALGDDVSGNGNDFTVNNLTAIDQTTDTPTNNFATLNSIWGDNISAGSMTYSNGNTTYQPTTNGNSYTRSTFGMSNKGKWYAEMKITEVSTGQSASLTVTPDTNFGASLDSGYGFQVQLNASNTVLNKVVGGIVTSINESFASGSIAMLAVDLDNGKMWVGYNGTWWNNNNASSTLDVSNPDGTGISTSYDYIYGFQAYWQTGGYYNIADVNFGNPSFTISSGNTDGNGYGNFEYAVPSGYLSLCTKIYRKY